MQRLVPAIALALCVGFSVAHASNKWSMVGTGCMPERQSFSIVGYSLSGLVVAPGVALIQCPIEYLDGHALTSLSMTFQNNATAAGNAFIANLEAMDKASGAVTYLGALNCTSFGGTIPFTCTTALSFTPNTAAFNYFVEIQVNHLAASTLVVLVHLTLEGV